VSVPALVLSQVVGRVAVLSYNRPEVHNARNDAMTLAWETALDRALDAAEIGAIVLRGEGPSFSSGRDVRELGDRKAGEDDESFIARAQERQLKILMSPKPVIAALRGYVLGGALETALACDLRVADSTAQLAFPEIGHDLITDTGGIPLATRLAGPSRAKYLVMTGRRIEAEQALAWGLVDEVVAPEVLDDHVLALAQAIASASPEAVAHAKRIADASSALDVPSAMRLELAAQVELFASRRANAR
jgi:enoyl-CoA hydratase/carnithine racemase